ncbi:unnamed protein product [Camellia sinensis]
MDAQPSKAPEVVTIDVHAAKLLITSGHRYLGVRDAEDFKNVCNMGGGYLAWVENGFAVTKPSEEKVVL